MDLAEMLARVAALDEGDTSTRPSRPSETQLVAQVMDLQAIAAAYAIGCPFVFGNIITPRSNCNIRGHGRPHVVVEVLSEPMCDMISADGPASTTSNAFGRRIDCRVICFNETGDHMAPFWVESWQYEPYAGPLPSDHGRLS